MLTNMNTGSSATALGLNVAGSRPPLIVSSSTKVANLNADLVDGKSATGFIQGQGNGRSGVLVRAPGTSQLDLVSVPGLGNFRAECVSGIPTAALTYTNNSGTTVELSWVENRFENNSGSNTAYGASTPNGGTIQNILDDYPPNPADVTTWQLSRDSSGPALATVETSIIFDSGGNCVFRGSVIQFA